MSGIFLNSTEFFPSDAPVTLTKVGAALVSANGTRRWVQRAHKRAWDLSWEGVSNATRAAVQTIALLTTTFTYVDQLGVSYTVQCEEDCFTASVSAIEPSGTIRYDVALKVVEA